MRRIPPAPADSGTGLALLGGSHFGNYFHHIPLPEFMASLEVRDTLKPDETRKYEKCTASLIKIGGTRVGRLHLEPGWKWSTHMGALLDMRSCRVPHFQYHVSGVIRFAMDDGTYRDIGPGEVSFVPAGHDAWVIGDEPVEIVDFHGLVGLPPASK